MAQALEIQTVVTVDSIADAVGFRIIEQRQQRDVCPWQAVKLSSSPSCQNWTKREEPVTPQKNKFDNTYAIRLACGMYTVMSSMHAVRDSRNGQLTPSNSLISTTHGTGWKQPEYATKSRKL